MPRLMASVWVSQVASRDSFFGKDSDARVEKLANKVTKKAIKKIKLGGKALLEFEALYSGLHWLVAGGG